MNDLKFYFVRPNQRNQVNKIDLWRHHYCDQIYHQDYLIWCRLTLVRLRYEHHEVSQSCPLGNNRLALSGLTATVEVVPMRKSAVLLKSESWQSCEKPFSSSIRLLLSNDRVSKRENHDGTLLDCVVVDISFCQSLCWLSSIMCLKYWLRHRRRYRFSVPQLMHPWHCSCSSS